MQKQVLQNLEAKEIISQRNVADLRWYIREKNPDTPGSMLASILADALHKVMDANLSYFGQEDRSRIRKKVFEGAAEKNCFSVNAAEVFHVCISMKHTGEAFRESLVKWISSNQALEVDRDFISTYFPGKPDGDPRPQSTIVPVPSEDIKRLFWKRRKGFPNALLFSLLTAAAACIIFTAVKFLPPQPSAGVQTVDAVLEQQESTGHGLGYVEVEATSLRSWLSTKNSLLAEEPYFSSILKVCRQYDVHPLLMFAIAGQEQAFVPKNDKNARKMANNPFNVYGSWQKYNTDIQDSAELAAGLIVRSIEDMPAGEDAIRWINKKYAEDPEWWIKVTWIFEKMKRDMLFQ